jgi:dynactin complex subunit
MWRLSCVNIRANCAVNSATSILRDMSKTTQQLNYAVQRLNADFDDWDTIRETITPLEARARRLIRWKRSLRTRCKFRLVKLETQTTITPIEAET